MWIRQFLSLPSCATFRFSIPFIISCLLMLLWANCYMSTNWRELWFNLFIASFRSDYYHIFHLFFLALTLIFILCLLYFSQRKRQAFCCHCLQYFLYNNVIIDARRSAWLWLKRISYLGQMLNSLDVMWYSSCRLNTNNTNNRKAEKKSGEEMGNIVIETEYLRKWQSSYSCNEWNWHFNRPFVQFYKYFMVGDKMVNVYDLQCTSGGGAQSTHNECDNQQRKLSPKFFTIK